MIYYLFLYQLLLQMLYGRTFIIVILKTMDHITSLVI